MSWYIFLPLRRALKYSERLTALIPLLLIARKNLHWLWSPSICRHSPRSKPLHFPCDWGTRRIARVELGGHVVVIALAERDMIICLSEKAHVAFVGDQVIDHCCGLTASVAVGIYREESGGVLSPGVVSSVHCLLPVSLGVVLSGLEVF